MSEIQTEIGKGLRRYRVLNKMTQKQLSEAIGMEESSYARVERGEKGISMEKLIQACRFFHITLDDMVRLEKSDHDSNNKEKYYKDICRKLENCTAEQLLIIDKLVDTVNQYI